MQNNIYTIRETIRGDVDSILAITSGEGVFSDVEVATVDELLTEYFTKGAEVSGYYFLSCLDGSRVVGYSCHGPRALTEGTYDLFWIATDHSEWGRGVGGALLSRVRREVQAAGGRLIIAETSSRSEYETTRRFYEKYGFKLEAVIKDFYSLGDDIDMYIDRI